MSFGNPENKSPIRWGPRWVAAGIWGAFILLCLGMAVNHGLSCADDGWYALVAKSLTQGQGYSTPFTDRGECLEPVRFNPYTGTGPTLILPCAALLKVVGISDVVPGIAAILVWGSVFTLLLILIAREVTDWSLPLGVGLFCLTIAALFNSSPIWSMCLGEIPAVAFLAMGHWLAATGKLSRRLLFFSGLFLGLAVQTKLLSALACIGALFILAVRLNAARGDLKKCSTQAALFFLGGALPTLLFEAWKLADLGFHGWQLHWQQFMAALHEMTMEKPAQITLDLIQQRIGLATHHYSFHLIFLVSVVAAAFYLLWHRPASPWLRLFTGLVISIFCSSSYWLLSSVGWIRYLAMAVGLGCFALSVPIYGLTQMWKKLLFAVLLLFFLSSGLALFWPRVTQLENGLFHPSKDRLARNKVVAAIHELKRQGPLTLVSRYWAEFTDVEYLLDGSMNFQQLGFNKTDGAPAPRVAGLPGKKVALINRHWGASFRAEHPVDERADIERLLDEKITAVLFSEGPYELLEITGRTTPAIASLVTATQTELGKKLNASILATPKPAPSGDGSGVTLLDWNTGDGSLGEVYLSENGGPEILVTRSSRMMTTVPWMAAGPIYEFRLYLAPDRKNLLATVKVAESATSTTVAPVTVAQTDLGKQLNAYISAAPNPVPPGPGAGTTWLDWNTGDGSLGEVYLSVNGGPEILFTRSNQSVRDIPWISAGATYEFRLYQSPDRKNLLATVKVTRLAQ